MEPPRRRKQTDHNQISPRREEVWLFALPESRLTQKARTAQLTRFDRGLSGSEEGWVTGVVGVLNIPGSCCDHGGEHDDCGY
jgi:hypothetical protein